MTKFLKSGELTNNWFEIDAKDAVIGRLVARMMTQSTGPGNYFRLKAQVERKTNSDDFAKRAS